MRSFSVKRQSFLCRTHPTSLCHTSAGLDLSESNFDSPLGRKSLRKM
jgi:hypothetical protein